MYLQSDKEATLTRLRYLQVWQRSHTDQVEVFTGLTEEEALHPVFKLFGVDIMQSSIATPEDHSTSLMKMWPHSHET